LHKLILEIKDFKSTVEILICDNGSKILNTKHLLQEDNNFRHLVNTVNIGLEGNIKKIVENSFGKYVWLLSDDDIIVDGSIRTLLKQIGEYESDCYFLTYGDKYGLQLNNFFSEAVKRVNNEEFLSNYWKSAIFISVVIYKTDVAKEALRNIEALKIKNCVYPQLLIVFFIFKQNRIFYAVGGLKILDSQIYKNYNIKSAYRVRIRDILIFNSQLRIMGYSNLELLYIRQWIKSSIINYSLQISYEFGTLREKYIIIFLSLKSIMSSSNEGFRFLLLSFLPLHLISIFSNNIAFRFYGLVFRLIGKNDLNTLIQKRGLVWSNKIVASDTHVGYDPS
jgi:hypothetical protein